MEELMKQAMTGSKVSDISIFKDINDLKKCIKNIENKIHIMDQTLEKLFDILNTISVLIEENDYSEEEEDSEDWTPYDDNNFSYEDNDDYDSYDSYDNDSSF